MTAVEVHQTNGLASSGVNIDYDAVLKALNLNARDPKTQALLLVCDRYGLDPVLKHIVLISGNAYVTRDGYLAVAHRSGQFDGMEVLEEGETDKHYTAKVAVHRKDMAVPFVFNGRYPKAKNMAKEYGPEMAIKVAEVQALRRAFNVTGLSSADERWAEDAQRPAQVAPAMLDRSQIVRPPPGQQAEPEVTASEHGEVIEATVVGDAAIREDAEVAGALAPTATASKSASPATAPKVKPDGPATVKTLNALRKLVKGPDEDVAAKCGEVLNHPVTDLFELSEVDAITCIAQLEASF